MNTRLRCKGRHEERRHARPGAFVSRSPAATLCGLFLLIFVAFPSAGFAADDVVIQGEIVAQPAFGQVVIPDESFELWMFGNGKSDEGRRRLDALLQIKIDNVERSCVTTAAQRGKLALAGQGDIQRFFERVDIVRKKFESIRHDIKRVNEVMHDLRPLQAELSKGLFGNGSLFAKTLKKTLSAEQVERYARADRERRRFALHAQVEMTTASLGNALGLRAEQREKLADLLLEEVHFVVRPCAAQTQLILYQISRIPEERLKPLFDPGQWRILSWRLAQVRQLNHVDRQNLILVDGDADEIRFAPQGNGVLPPGDGRGVNAVAPARLIRPAQEIRK